MKHFSTGQVADILGVPVHRISYLTRDRQIRPAKGPTGAFDWTEADIARAASAIGVEFTPDKTRSADWPSVS